MTKLHHPSNRLERFKALVKKNEKKAKKQDRSGHVWRKLHVERVKEQETHDDLREYTQG